MSFVVEGKENIKANDVGGGAKLALGSLEAWDTPRLETEMPFKPDLRKGPHLASNPRFQKRKLTDRLAAEAFSLSDRGYENSLSCS